MKKTLYLLLSVIICGGAIYWWRGFGSQAEEMGTTLNTAVAKRMPLRQEALVPGSIKSNRDIEIKCRASGEIIKLPFDVSDSVKKDDLLLELDPVDQERLLQQSQATLAASQAKFAQAQNNLRTAEQTIEAEKVKTAAALDAAKARAEDTKAKAKRQEELFQKKYSSPEQYETAKTSAIQAEQDLRTAHARLADIKTQEQELETRRQEIELSKSQVKSNEIALALAQRQLGYTKVYAPIDAVVAARNVQIGQIISSGVTNVGGGTTALVLSDMSHIFIYASVDESYIGQVELGQKALIQVDAYPDLQFEGKVDRIGTKGLNTQGVVTFEVRIEVTSENRNLLKPEMTADSSIIIADKENVVAVPSSCIIRDRQKSFVTLVKSDGTLEERHPVEIGISDGVDTEIVSGVNEGETVVVYRPEDESRWRTNENDPGRTRRRQDQMMYRALGGGRPGGGRR